MRFSHVFIIGFIALAGCATETTPSPQEGNNSGASQQGEIAARVNGENVPMSAYQNALLQARQVAGMQGVDPESAELEQQAIDHVIATVLLRQEAERSGTTVSNEKLEQQYLQTVEQIGGEEALEEQLEAAGLTEEMLRKQIEEQLLTQAYVEQALEGEDFLVTDEELQEFYTKIEAEYGEQAPPFAEIEVTLRAQLQEQKRQLSISALVTSLREKADVEVLL